MKKNLKKISAMFLAAMMVIGTVGCGASSGVGKGSEEATSDGGSGPTQITVAYNGLLTSLYPYQSQAPQFVSFQYSVLETLFRRSKDNALELEPQIGESYTQIDEEGYSWEVKIKDYVHDSEGNEIKASDVIFSMRELEKSGFGVFYGYNQIESLEAVDDYTIHVTLDNNEDQLIEQFLMICPIISQKAFEQSSDEMATTLIATGPYKVKEFISGSSLTLELNENYWEPDESKRCWMSQTNVEVIKNIYIGENSQLEVALETGEVDFVDTIAASSLNLFEGNEDYTIVEVPATSVFTMIISGDANGPTSDLRVRQAIAHAIDQQGLIDAIYNGHATKTNFEMIALDDYQEAWADEVYYEYDPEKAAAKLAEAGYGPGELKLNFITSGSGVPVAELCEIYLEEAGFDITVNQLEAAMFQSTLLKPTEFDLGMTYVGMLSNAVSFGARFDARKNNGMSLEGYQDPELQSLVEAATRRGHTEEELDTLHRYMNDNVIDYPMLTLHYLSIYRSDCGIEELAFEENNQKLYHCFKYSWN